MAETTEVLVIDGEEYDLGQDDLTFGEQRALRKLVRDLAEDPDLNPVEATLADFLPALVTVIKQRTDASYTVEDALGLKYEDVIQERPQKAAKPAAKKTPAASGSRQTS